MNKTFLKALLAAYSPSGYEDLNPSNTISCFETELSLVDNLKNEGRDPIGNQYFSVGAENPKVKIMISGHCDEIACQVQYIDENGFIHFIADGGIDKKVILGARVIIITESGTVHGVIGKKPIHVEHGDKENDKVTELSEMKIDIGCRNKEEAMQHVNIGDPIIIDGEYRELCGGRFTSRGLDDKVGVFVVGEVLAALSKTDLKNVRVYGVACTQEETSASGAVSAAVNINPNYSIDYDVTFATDDGYVAKEKWGDVKLGNGAALAHGVDSNHKFMKTIRKACVDNKIPFQEFSVRSGCTDTVHIKQSAYNCQTALISIPNRNMHTQSEVCDFNDLQSAIDMTIATILELDKNAE